MALPPSPLVRDVAAALRTSLSQQMQASYPHQLLKRSHTLPWPQVQVRCPVGHVHRQR